MAMGSDERRTVVITGLGLVTPLGVGREAFWQSVLRGQSGVRLIESLTGHDLRADYGCPVHDFDPKALVRPRKALKVMCREIQTGYAAAQMAWDDADLQNQPPDPERVGVVFGSEMMYGEWSELEGAIQRCDIAGDGIDATRWGAVAMSDIFPLWMLKYLPNMTACHVAIALDARGPNNTLTLDDCSGLSAIAEAVRYIERGHADIVLAGASGTRINPARSLWLNPLPTALRRDPLAGSCQPWAMGRDGSVGGEGAAVLVLESAESALRRSRTPLAKIASTSSVYIAAAGRRGSIQAVAGSVAAACSAAGVPPSALGGCLGHGTGDSEMDAASGRGLSLANIECPVTTLQQTLGHCGAACGLIDAATAVLSLADHRLPHLPFLGDIDASCGIDVVRDQPRPITRNAVLVVNHTVRGLSCGLVVRPAD
jgi:3-oxoacyl-[acyl-carrier-protein] synthase II